MYLKYFLKKYKGKKIKIFVDMDGVIVDYEVGLPYDFHKKRPLFTSIRKLRRISRMRNVEVFILSVSRTDEGVKEKNYWLNKFAVFFKRKNRIIISRESNNNEKACILKANYIKNLERNGDVIIVIDDDPRVLNEIRQQNEDVVLLKDTSLID